MKFNRKTSETTTNHMGAKAFTLSPEMELYTAAVTSFVDNTYYEKVNDRLNRIRECIRKVDPEFVARLAVYAREQMNLRAMPLVLVVELARVHRGDDLVSRTIQRVVQRADEMAEVLAYFQAAESRSGTKKLNRLPKQIQKGLAAALNKFDEYQFAKYDRAGAVRLRDVLFIAHPKAKDEVQQALFDKIASETLAVPFTWETEISALGQRQFGSEGERAAALAQAWEDLVTSGKMGYMATLRNLRNIILKGSDHALDRAIDYIIDRKAVRKSKQLPFRFLSAYEEVSKVAKEEGATKAVQAKVARVEAAIATALEISTDNIPHIQGRTLVLTDNSGSMRGDYGGKSAVSAMSKRSSADIANLFSVLFWTRMPETQIGLFGDRLLTPALSRKASIFENFKTIDKTANGCGGATERGIFNMFEKLVREKIMVDNIIIFSDCQIGTGCNWFDNEGNRGEAFDKLFNAYKAINPGVTTYSIDLRGYGNTMCSEGLITLAGWSEKLFDLVAAYAQGVDAVEFIRKMDI
ncbi:MAG: TROVE domain-containing protein [Bacteroidia bacterium]